MISVFNLPFIFLFRQFGIGLRMCFLREQGQAATAVFASTTGDGTTTGAVGGSAACGAGSSALLILTAFLHFGQMAHPLEGLRKTPQHLPVALAALISSRILPFCFSSLALTLKAARRSAQRARFSALAFCNE